MTTTGQPDSRSNEEYDLELYKSLRHEAVAYLEKIPAVWLQKFVFAGAVLTFVVAKPTEVPAFAARSNDVIVAGFLCVPLLALVLDVKIFEYSLHARSISRFIERHFAHNPKVTAWEAALWGGGSEGDIATLARYRSAATVAVTLLSTALLIMLSGAVIGSVLEDMSSALAVAALVALTYIAIGAWSTIVIWPRLGSRKASS